MEQENLKALLCLNRFEAPRKVIDRLEQGESLLQIWESVSSQNESLDSFNALAEIERCAERGVRLLTWFDEDYPSLLRPIYDPPLVLYMKGTIISEDTSALAIVGTRHPSLYGRNQARSIARELSACGLTIVSGFAKGVDYEAHTGALEISYGRTIAVKGCGLDVDYPQGHQKLFDQIMGEHGAILSEYPLGTTPRAEFFPRRNRIISGLTLGTLIIEASLRSGSLITAGQAIEQGREVFCLPGQVHYPTAKGTHQLIKNGAALVEHAGDILEALSLSLTAQQHGALERLGKTSEHLTDAQPTPPNPKPESKRDPSEVKVLDLIKTGKADYDTLLEKSDMAHSQLASLLLTLEIQGKIKKAPVGYSVKEK